MARAVLLEHAESGATHFDLLIERDHSAADRRLRSFRVETPLDPTRTAEFQALAVPDHRVIYLDYQGPLPAPGNLSSTARGHVRRLWTAPISLAELSDTCLELVFHAPAARFTAERLTPPSGSHLGEWRFTRA
jgi:hypothetical protein